MRKSNFVVVAHARSGSHMITSMLNTHPDIHCNGEKFNKANQELCDRIYVKYMSFENNPFTIAGFKLSYPLRVSRKNDIWEKIRGNKQVKVIHWYRANLLRAYVSSVIASKTKKWMGLGEQPQLTEKQVTIDTNLCVRWINKMVRIHALVQFDFHHHSVFSVSYENFLSDDNKEKEMLDFLGVEKDGIQLSTPLVKQNPEPLDQIIINYSDFATQFRKTKWSIFL